jgi:hypothetical protein
VLMLASRVAGFACDEQDRLARCFSKGCATDEGEGCDE